MVFSCKSKKAVAPAVLLFFLLQTFQCFGISVKEEQEMGQEFMRMVRSRMPLIQDPGVNAYVNELGQEIVKQIGPQPFQYHFYVVREDSFNAFAGPGAHICVNSGLIAKMESEAELAGIMGHEIAHVTCRHISDKIQRSSKSNLISLAGMVAGIFLGIGGMAEASQAVIMGTLSGVQSADLAYSREDEVQADFYGLEYLEKAGYSANGLLTALKRIKEADYLGADYPVYLSTHPAVDDRIVFISSRVKEKPETPHTATTLSFKQAQTRLMVEHQSRDQSINTFKAAVARDPDDPLAHYGYGLALLKAGRYDQAIINLEIAHAALPKDPFLKFDLGKAYCMDDKYKKAIAYFETADKSFKDPEIKLYLGRCQMELGDLKDAENTFQELLKPASQKHPAEIQLEDKPQTDDKSSKKTDPMAEFLKPPLESAAQLRAMFSLAEVYHRSNRLGESHYYLGNYYQKIRKSDTARFHFNKALEYDLDEAKKEEIAQTLQMMERAARHNRSRSDSGQGNLNYLS